MKACAAWASRGPTLTALPADRERDRAACCLIAWLGENPEHQLVDGYNGFRVDVSNAGDTRIERHDD